MSKKRYPDEFKIEAVKQVVDAGHSVADVAGRLGMTTHSLYAWISKFGPDSSEHIAKSDDQAEIRRLKTELKRTTEERDLLKKAAVGSIGHCNTYSFNLYGSELLNETNVFSRRAGPCI